MTLRQITVWVVAAHLLALLGIGWLQRAPSKPLTERVVVRTVALAPKAAKPAQAAVAPPERPKEEPAQPSAAPSKKEKAEVEQAEPPPKPAPKPVEAKPKKTQRHTEAKPKTKKEQKSASKEAQNPKPKEKTAKPAKEAAAKEAAARKAKEKAAAAEQQRLLEAVQQALAGATETKASLPSSPLTVPQPIGELRIESAATAARVGEAASGAVATYEELLIEHLRLYLKLPEYGAVKVKLQLSREGQVRQVQVVQAESQKNRQYVEQRLPKLCFAPFGLLFPGEQEHSFALTLRNDL